MNKFGKFIIKVIYTVICFSLVPCVLSIFNFVPVNADEDASTMYVPDPYFSVTVQTGVSGKKFKLSEKTHIQLTAYVRDNIESPKDDVYITFRSSTHPLSYAYHCDDRFYPEDSVKKVYIFGHNADNEWDYREINTDTYTQDRLWFCFLNGSEEYEQFYTEGCQLRLSVDLRALAVAESPESGSLAVTVRTIDGEYRSRSHGIYFATDGNYVAFSYESSEDAMAILMETNDAPAVDNDTPVDIEPPHDAHDEPRNFWSVFEDIFNGCD